MDMGMIMKTDDHNKEQALNQIIGLNQEITDLSDGRSLATLDYKIKKRHECLVEFFDQFLDDINPDEMSFLQDMQRQTQDLIDMMESKKNSMAQEILKHKKTGKRMRIYTTIAKQK